LLRGAESVPRSELKQIVIHTTGDLWGGKDRRHILMLLGNVANALSANLELRLIVKLRLFATGAAPLKKTKSAKNYGRLRLAHKIRRVMYN
jgi:hypothetical protein